MRSRAARALEPTFVLNRFPILAVSLIVGLLVVLVPVPAVSGDDGPNLVANPGCESSTAGWGAWQGTLKRSTDSPRTGRASCQVSYRGGGYYTLDDVPASVAAPRQGDRYTASAWVRSKSAAGRAVTLFLRQTGGAVEAVRAESASVALDSAWRRLEVTTTIDSADRGELDLYVAQDQASGGQSFHVDDVSLTLVGGGGGGGSTPSARDWNARTFSGALFSAASPWNVAATGVADPLSEAMIGNLQAAFQRRPLAINLDNYTVPLYYADAATKQYTVRDSSDWWGGMTAPLPDGASPDKGGDRHLAVWDVAAGRLYEFWDMRKRSGRWEAGYGIVLDARGAGHQTTLGAGSARAYGGSLVGGLIRYQEMKDRRITHALAMAYPTTRGDAYAAGWGAGRVLAIATHADGEYAGNRTRSNNIPLGARLRLRSGVDLTARCGKNAACLAIGEALRTYGAFMVDTAEVPVVYAEGLRGKDVSWTGVLDANDLRGFQARDFEVLALPPLTRQN